MEFAGHLNLRMLQVQWRFLTSTCSFDFFWWISFLPPKWLTPPTPQGTPRGGRVPRCLLIPLSVWSKWSCPRLASNNPGGSSSPRPGQILWTRRGYSVGQDCADDPLLTGKAQTGRIYICPGLDKDSRTRSNFTENLKKIAPGPFLCTNLFENQEHFITQQVQICSFAPAVSMLVFAIVIQVLQGPFPPFKGNSVGVRILASCGIVMTTVDSGDPYRVPSPFVI